MDVGFIGLGAMGRPMAANLAAAGHRVVAWNRSPVEPPEGVVLGKSPRHLAKEAPVVFTMLTDGPAVEAVLFGEDGWVSGAAAGGTVVQTSTIGPTAVGPIAVRLESAGLHLLDAPVSGSVKPAINRELVILGGGIRSCSSASSLCLRPSRRGRSTSARWAPVRLRSSPSTASWWR